MKYFTIGIFIISIFLFCPSSVLAADKFITIINPIRISEYSTNPLQSIKNQYTEVQARDLKATWLLTYDVLINQDIVEVVDSFDQQQELGLFLEITPQLTRNVGIVYPETDSWHRANVLFLSGYELRERKVLIDKLFKEYKDKFGKYPLSVGAWWIDAYSLNYMKSKYDIKAILVCADQFSTDGYQIWGQNWSLPYIPSRQHPAIPADGTENDSGVVAIQWAMRDPLNGYQTPSGMRASLYSTQDYFTLNLNDQYLKDLAEVYLYNSAPISQLTLGLEGDFEPNTYKEGNYIKYLDLAKELQVSGVQVVKMSEYSKWYRSRNYTNPIQIIQTKDILKSDKTVIWYQSSQYRVGMVYDFSTFEILDLRFYDQAYLDPYTNQKNYYLDLEINLPSIIDSVSNSNEKIVIPRHVLSTQVNDSVLMINFDENQKIKFEKSRIVFTGLDNWIESKIPDLTHKNDQFVLTNQTKQTDNTQSFLSQQLNAKISSKKIFAVAIIIALIVGIGFLSLLMKKVYLYYFSKILLIILTLSILVFILYNQPLFQTYSINLEEIAAIKKISNFHNAKVLVSSNKCVNCQLDSIYQPLFLTGQRSYISKLSNQNVYKSDLLPTTTNEKHILEAKYTRQQLYEYLSRSGANYIYLVKYGSYEEVLPYSPGDLGVEKIFNNAHVQIWRIKR